MKTEIQQLEALPLEKLISAPLNAIIAAQTNAALSTVQFIEKVGLENTTRRSLFDKKDENSKSRIRMASLKVEKLTRGADGEVATTTEAVEFPFISLFNVPSFEISSMDWDFNVRLMSVEEFSVDFTHSQTSTMEGSGKGDAGLQEMGIPIGVGASMKVSTTATSNFELRYGAGRENEYNLHINVKANAAPIPRGIGRLLDIVEKIATENEAVKNEPKQLPPAP